MLGDAPGGLLHSTRNFVKVSLCCQRQLSAPLPVKAALPYGISQNNQAVFKRRCSQGSPQGAWQQSLA